ncbi:MAG TPA: DNA repair protein RecN [Candidatus Mediterraneibacter excrementavium]|nr:DNA repair protein RecN [Candidatus Mediterraneibacter excrementavium]
MLLNLHVKNLALINESEVDFGRGLNILTGETGAGKSILMGSVNLAMGGRYTADMLRSGAENGVVEITFSLEDERIIRRLEESGIQAEDGLVTLSRRLMDGKSISRINGETVGMGALKETAGQLIDIHGQHDSQTLLNRKNHLALLDLYAGEKIIPVKKEMAQEYDELQKIRRQLEETSLDEESRRRELSLAEYEVHEIEEAALLEGEDDDLEERYRRMTQSRKITEAVAETYQFTAEKDGANASECLSRAIRAFQDAADFDSQAAQLYSQLLDADSLLNDFNRELSEYAKSFEFSEEEFRETGERLNLINHLKSKYGKTISEISAYCEEKKQRIETLNDYDAFLAGLEEKRAKAEKKAGETAALLSRIRKENALLFAEEIRTQMKDLNFLDNRLEIHLGDTGQYSANGRDDAEFFLAVNPGEPLKPLASIASGGELSRIMLAVKTVLADREDTPTLIFDEIDAGISGITADKVAEKLRLISRNRQVICITHLPQIAAAADVHFVIRKNADNGMAYTDIRKLDKEESVMELARLLGGSKITEAVMQSAAEMKELALKSR